MYFRLHQRMQWILLGSLHKLQASLTTWSFWKELHYLVGLLLTILLATLFTILQGFEYVSAPFTITDSVFGSCFYMTTGFHGFHVFVGTCCLLVSLFRIIINHFTNTHHFGFESGIWYWHFVDVVWLFLFVCVYWWGS